ncbi:hypothetical protein EH221_04290 [bacterium]|nr:MAG: hypothetical protein EH221_04290 [bacterium]
MKEPIFKEGDWIVHNAYGVGQIRSIEQKPIHGETVSVFRVKTRNSIYWLPIENADNSRVRRISGQEKLDQALAQLETAPENMGTDYRSRNNHISEILAGGSIVEKVGLLRDLLGLRGEKVWSNTENDTARMIFDQLSSEYSVIYDVPLEHAKAKINAIILKNFPNFSMI